MMIDGLANLTASGLKATLRATTRFARRFLRWVWETNDRLARVFGVGAVIVVLLLIAHSPPFNALGAPLIAEALATMLVIFLVVATIFGGSRYR